MVTRRDLSTSAPDRLEVLLSSPVLEALISEAEHQAEENPSAIAPRLFSSWMADVRRLSDECYRAHLEGDTARAWHLGATAGDLIREGLRSHAYNLGREDLLQAAA